jgi:hypothetical protein
MLLQLNATADDQSGKPRSSPQASGKSMKGAQNQYMRYGLTRQDFEGQANCKRGERMGNRSLASSLRTML